MEETLVETPPQTSHRRTIIMTLLTLVLLILATVGAILYGMGYRLDFNESGPKIAHTGILNASSSPTGAQVYVDSHLTTATNNAVNLVPGKYTITMTKEGYQPWKKDIIIQDQVVTNANALLLPQAPTLQSISTVGIANPVLDPTQTKLAFTVSSESAQTKNGIYVLDMSTRNFPVLPIQTSSLQIADDTVASFSQAKLSWSPDGQQILATIAGTDGQSPTYYLLQANQMNTTPNDVTATLPTLQDTWKSQLSDKDKLRQQSLKPAVRSLLQQYAQVIGWSDDDDKVLYVASQDATLPILIKPRRIGNNPLYEVRNIVKGGVYVYNMTEDVNTKILDQSPVSCDITNPDCQVPLQWFPDSQHLIYVQDHKINIVEMDGSNMTTIYAGPFDDKYVFVWPDGSKLVILTNLDNTNIPPTFYTISLQ
ncbi:MAG TPA: PEGA domain-containing protein [Patescibacteria group bacterium]|nr:PEGA domain-containing protein [Patescibacteria group bacterium]